MNVVINPGTGPCLEANESEALTNMLHFLTDLGDKDVRSVRVPAIDYGEGRFGFLIWKESINRCYEVQMPGLPLDRVRYMGRPQNAWDFPRLYVDGSSWLWCFAINVCDFKEDDK